jgi:hypothetical protein
MAILFTSYKKIDTYRRMPMRTRLLTWDGRSSFEYERKGDNTITVYHGENYAYSLVLGAPLFDQLILTFAGKTVRLNHCLAEENIEDWLGKNGIRTKITRYLAPILRHEGYTVEGARRGTIRFT